jgi:hypothetical protein
MLDQRGHRSPGGNAGARWAGECLRDVRCRVPPNVLPEDEAIRMEVNGLGSAAYGDCHRNAYGDRYRKLRAQKRVAAGFARAAIVALSEQAAAL